MQIKCRFADAVPEQKLETFALSRGAASSIWESAYEGGFRGCFLPTDEGTLGRAARYYADEFRDVAGKQQATFDLVYDRLGDFGADTSEGYIASIDAFAAWQRDKDPSVDDWLFEFLQNSGNCVGASWTEMLQGLTASRAMDPSFNERMRFLVAMWVYMFRGYCGAGWYGGACAARTVEYGYAFSKVYDLPNLGRNFDYDGEQTSEDYTVRTWCRNQPDDFIQYVRDQGWFFESGAITEFSGGADALKRVVQNKGQVHHGSNYTSASSTPDRVRRIGGHMQTMFGADWSERTVDFFRAKGVSFNTTDNFPCVNHQTWGGGWSGECADSYWPEWWGPKPQGAWVMGAKNQLRYFSDGYVYLPQMRGIPGNGPSPPPPPADTQISGELTGEVIAGGRVRLNGLLTANGIEHTPVEQPGAGLSYRFVPVVKGVMEDAGK